MYENIGKKIKCAAKVAAAIIAIASIVVGICLMVDWSDDVSWYGLGLLIVGPLNAWLSSWMLYGFGEIIDHLATIAANTGKLRSIAGSNASAAPAPKTASAAPAPKTANEEKKSELLGLLVQGLITNDEFNEAMKKL